MYDVTENVEITTNSHLFCIDHDLRVPGWCDLVSADVVLPGPPSLGNMGGISNVKLTVIPDTNIAHGAGGMGGGGTP